MTVHNVETVFENSIQNAAMSDRQKAVLRASLTLFAKQGYDKTSTSDIAKLAQVSDGTVFRRFKTKRGIYNALLEPFVRQVIPQIAVEFMAQTTANRFETFAELLRYVARDRMQFVYDNKSYIKIFAQELISNPQTIAHLFDQYSATILQQLELVLKQYQQKGQLVDWPASRIGRYIIGVFVSHMAPVVIFETEPDFNLDRACDEAVEFLIRGLQPTR